MGGPVRGRGGGRVSVNSESPEQSREEGIEEDIVLALWLEKPVYAEIFSI